MRDGTFADSNDQVTQKLKEAYAAIAQNDKLIEKIATNVIKWLIHRTIYEDYGIDISNKQVFFRTTSVEKLRPIIKTPEIEAAVERFGNFLIFLFINRFGDKLETIESSVVQRLISSLQYKVGAFSSEKWGLDHRIKYAVEKYAKADAARDFELLRQKLDT